jgi:hypothetical protein
LRSPTISFEYSNQNYTTLGLIVQTVSGESYEHYVKEHILIPLNMKDSFMFVPEAQRHSLATGHEYWFGWPFSGGGITGNRAATPSGYISSSAQDMSHYLIAQLNGGRYEGTQVLSAAGIAEMHQGTADMHAGGSSYAMGWEDSELSGVRVVRHSGDTGNFHANMILVPESRWGVVVLMNGSNHLRLAGMDGIANGVVSLLLGHQPPPEPFEQAKVLLFVVVAIGALQVLGIVRSDVLVRRWRRQPERRPHGVLRIGLRVVVPMGANLLWAVTVSSSCRGSHKHRYRLWWLPTSVWCRCSAARSRFAGASFSGLCWCFARSVRRAHPEMLVRRKQAEHRDGLRNPSCGNVRLFSRVRGRVILRIRLHDPA